MMSFSWRAFGTVLGRLTIPVAFFCLGVALILPGPVGAFRATPAAATSRRTIQAHAPLMPGNAGRTAAALQMSGDTGWKILWDQATGAPAVMTGPPMNLLHGQQETAPNYAMAARQFIEQRASLFGVASTDFKVARAVRSGRTWYVRLEQYHGGIPVVGAGVDLRFRNGRLLLVRANVYPITSDFAVKPAINETAALASFRAGIGDTKRQSVALGSKLVVLPVHSDKGVSLALAWETRLTESSAKRWRGYVDAATGRVARYENEVLFVDTSVTVQGEHHPRVPSDTLVVSSLPYAEVGVVGSAVSYPANASGSAVVPVSGSATASFALYGTYTDVNNDDAADMSGSTTVNEGVDASYLLSGSVAEQDAYYSHTVVHDRMKEMAPDLDWLDERLVVNVNVSGSCNAYWDGVKVNFYEEGNGCSNTATIADVVYHETGHGLHQHLMVAGTFDGAIGEGSADYIAATITGDSRIAPEFFGAETPDPIRDLAPNKVYPDDVQGQVHSDGLIWGGAFWDLRTAFIEAYGSAEGVAKADRLLADSLRGGPTLEDGYWEVLLADDDDDDLTNGTPNVCLINAAFGGHGLGPGTGPGLLFTHVSLGSQSPSETIVWSSEIRAQFPQCGAFDVSTATLHWRTAGSDTFESLSLSEIDADRFVASLDGVAPRTTIEYYLAAGDGDSHRTDPALAPDKLYSFYVADVVPIFSDDFEGDDLAWTHGFVGLGGDIDSGWDMGAPQGISGDPTFAFSGENVWGVDLWQDGVYRANETIYLDSPSIDCRGCKGARIQFRRWLNIEDGVYDQARIRVNGALVWQNDAGSGSSHHRDAAWYFHDIDVSAYADGEDITVRFELAADSGLQLGGWNIDDFAVVAADTGPPPRGCGCATVPHEGGGLPLSIVFLAAVSLATVLRRRP